ncbi:MAG: hypothetical protein WC861_00930 [Candidatus Micrarchaeia archaeon]|jgi:hypothetical protein
MRYNALLLGIMLAFTLAFASPYTVVPLTYSALSADTYRVATQAGDVACAATSSGDFSYQNAKMIQIVSHNPILGGPGDALSGNYYFAKVLFDPIGLTGNGSTSLNGTYYQSANVAQWAPRVFWKAPGRDCFNWDNFAYGDTGISNAIKLDIAGQNSAAQGSIYFTTTTQNPTLSGANVNIALKEDAGKSGTVSNTPVSTLVPVIAGNASYGTHRFKQAGGASAVYYIGVGQGAPNSFDTLFITERGSRWLFVGTTDASASVASKLATPTFVFRTATPPMPPLGSSWPTHTFGTLITDTVDRITQNRHNTQPEDEYPSLLSDSDVGQITSPLRSVQQGSPVAKNLYRIGAEQYATFADYTVIDQQSSLGSYVEKQAYWVGTTPAGVAYDASLKDIVVNKYSAMVASAKFEGNDFGIPVCTGDLNPYVPGDYTSCTNNSTVGIYGTNSLSDRHRLNVRFLNQQWIISEMVAPTAPLASGTEAINGGQIRLAKETLYGIIGINQTLYSSPLAVRLHDVLNAPGCEYGEYPAVYDLLDSNNAVVGQIQICPGNTYTFTLMGGPSMKIHPYRTNYDALPVARWAETGIYSDEIVLRDNHRYNLVSTSDPDRNFKVSLLWKNRDYTGGSSSTVADSLREMVVYNIDGFADKTPRMGVFNFLSSQPAFTVTYAGISVMQNVGIVPITAIDSMEGDGTESAPSDEAAPAKEALPAKEGKKR